MAVDSDENLLKACAECEGVSVDELLERATFDSVVPGICKECCHVQDGEPDARENWCYDCGRNTVASCLDLAGLI